MARHVDALNYPYIRIRDVDWLKKTLLLFPHVARISPYYDAPADDPAITPFCLTAGENRRPLLRPAELNSTHIRRAQSQLARQIRELDAADPQFRERYGKEASRKGAGETNAHLTFWERRLSDRATFQIHSEKLFDDVVEVLEEFELAWEPAPETSDGYRYLELHPVLGEAIMATLAAACAENEGLSVVTEFPKLHGRLIGVPREQILKTCLNDNPGIGKTSGEQLAQFLVYRRCDVSAAGPQDFVEIARERQALADFRDRLEKIAETLPETAYSEATLEERLNELTDEALREWQKEQKKFSDIGKRIFGENPLDEPAKFIQKLAEGTLKEAPAPLSGAAANALTAVAHGSSVAGLTIPLVVGATAGFAIAVMFKAVNGTIASAKAAKTSPMRYLSRLEEKGIAISLTAPCSEAPSPLPAAPAFV